MQHLGWGRAVHGLFLGTALILLVFVSGCGEQKGWLKTYQVKGKVQVDGKAVKGVVLTFHPRNQNPERTHFASGKTDENGEFVLTTFKPDDGAPAGEYDVTIIWPKRKNPLTLSWEGDKLNGHYATKEKAGIHITIEEQDQELPPFELSTEGPKKK